MADVLKTEQMLLTGSIPAIAGIEDPSKARMVLYQAGRPVHAPLDQVGLAVAANYLPLAGGTMTGALAVPTIVVGTTDGTSAGGGIRLYKRPSGFSESIYFSDAAGGFRGLISMDGSDQIVFRVGDSTTTDVTISTAGSVSVAGNLSATAGSIQTGQLFHSAVSSVILAPGSAGTVYFRPGGYNITTGQTTIDSAGNMTAAGNISATTSNFVGGAGGTAVQLGPALAGTIYLRPSGVGSATGETSISSSGILQVSSNITTATGTITAGASVTGSGTQGTQLFITGKIRTGCNTAAAFDHHEFWNTNASLVGYIRTTAAATAYSTSSDVNLKDVHGDYDPAEAVAIIRADPVQSFAWKADGREAVGWIAQKSHAVDPDLAMPPPPPEEGQPELKFGDEGYVPWGIDYGRRTPYLWAALSAALDRIDQLEIRIAALEAGA